jgi:predicted transcriptional regulator
MQMKKTKRSGARETAQTKKKASPQNQKIENIMTREVVTIAPENTLYDAARIMGEQRIGSLIVVKYDTAVGIITERDLLREVADKEIALEKDWLVGGVSIKEKTVEEAMSYPLIKISMQSSIKEAARMMLEKKIRRIAVSDEGRVVGIITAADLIKSLPETPEEMDPWFEVDYFMRRKITTVDEEMLVEDVAKIMGEKRVGSVIVTSNGEPMGIFTERDLLTKFMAQDKSLKIEVGEACSSPIITGSLGSSIHDAAEIMTSKHIKRLPISKKGKLVGILSARDLVEAYARAK